MTGQAVGALKKFAAGNARGGNPDTERGQAEFAGRRSGSELREAC